MKNKRMLGNLLLLFTAMIWGMAFAFQRSGMENIEPATFNAVRMSLAAAAVGAFALFRRGAHRRQQGEEKTPDRASDRVTLLGGVCCGAFLASASIFQQLGLVWTTAGKAGFLTALYMLLVPVIETLLFRRRHGARIWLAVALGVAGLYLLCIREGFSLVRGDALELVCALLFAGHILCCAHFAPRGDGVAIAAIQFAVASLFSAVMATLTEAPSLAGIAAAAVPILYCGLVSGGVGYTLQIVCRHRAGTASGKGKGNADGIKHKMRLLRALRQSHFIFLKTRVSCAKREKHIYCIISEYCLKQRYPA